MSYGPSMPAARRAVQTHGALGFLVIIVLEAVGALGAFSSAFRMPRPSSWASCLTADSPVPASSFLYFARAAGAVKIDGRPLIAVRAEWDSRVVDMFRFLFRMLFLIYREAALRIVNGMATAAFLCVP